MLGFIAVKATDCDSTSDEDSHDDGKVSSIIRLHDSHK